MSGKLRHKEVGSVLTETEYDDTDAHELVSQATGDLVYADAASGGLDGLAIGSTNQVLVVASGKPAWSSNVAVLGTLSVAGAVTINDAGADTDVRIEGDTDANLLVTDAGNDRVGIGIAAPLGKLHVYDGSSGATPTGVADGIVVEHAGAGGISILTPNTSNGDIQFGDPEDNDAGRVRYDHNTQQMQFFVEGAAKQVIGTANTSFNVYLKRLTTAGITASATQTQGSGALTAEINEVSTVATTNDTVTLPSAVEGYKIVVINNGANTLQIFPASGDNLGAGLNTATTLSAGSNVTYVAYDTTNWESI